jgi:hypothetical protein
MSLFAPQVTPPGFDTQPEVINLMSDSDMEQATAHPAPLSAASPPAFSRQRHSTTLAGTGDGTPAAQLPDAAGVQAATQAVEDEIAAPSVWFEVHHVCADNKQ